MVDAWIPLSKLAVLADVSEPTTRRYVASKALSKFFRTRKEARLTLVHLDAVPILKRAYLLSCQGKKMEEIEAIIPQEFPIVFDSEPSPPSSPAQAPTSTPALPDTLGHLVPILDRLATSFEKMVEMMDRRITALEDAPNRPFKGTDHQREGNGHDDVPEGQDKPSVNVVVNREAVIARVIELHGEGLGQHAITTRLRREGLRLSARGEISKSTVARIVKGDVS